MNNIKFSFNHYHGIFKHEYRTYLIYPKINKRDGTLSLSPNIAFLFSSKSKNPRVALFIVGLSNTDHHSRTARPYVAAQAPASSLRLGHDVKRCWTVRNSPQRRSNHTSFRCRPARCVAASTSQVPQPCMVDFLAGQGEANRHRSGSFQLAPDKLRLPQSAAVETRLGRLPPWLTFMSF